MRGVVSEKRRRAAGTSPRGCRTVARSYIGLRCNRPDGLALSQRRPANRPCPNLGLTPVVEILCAGEARIRGGYRCAPVSSRLQPPHSPSRRALQSVRTVPPLPPGPSSRPVCQRQSASSGARRRCRRHPGGPAALWRGIQRVEAPRPDDLPDREPSRTFVGGAPLHPAAPPRASRDCSAGLVLGAVKPGLQEEACGQCTRGEPRCERFCSAALPDPAVCRPFRLPEARPGAGGRALLRSDSSASSRLPRGHLETRRYDRTRSGRRRPRSVRLSRGMGGRGTAGHGSRPRAPRTGPPHPLRGAPVLSADTHAAHRDPLRPCARR